MLDADGFLRLTGREKDLIIRGGVNISPLEIDSILMQRPELIEVATVGVPHATRGENVAYNVLLDIALPLGAIAICGYTIYKSVHPLPPSPMKYGPWVALIWLGIGVAIVAWLAVTHPERVRAFGSILGEGEAVDERRASEARPAMNP